MISTRTLSKAVDYKFGDSNMSSAIVRDRISRLATPILVADTRRWIASAMNTAPDLVNIEGQQLGFSGWIMRSLGTVAGTRFFAKIFLADPYPVPPRFTTPGDELAMMQEAQRPIEDQVATEWQMTKEMRFLAGPDNVPAPLGCSVENRTLVLQEVDGLRLDYFVNWTWPDARRLASMEMAMFKAGEWLKTIHESSFRRFEAIDVLNVFEDLHELIRKRRLESTPYAELALKIMETARPGSYSKTFLRVPVALNHGDFSLPNLIWSHDRQHLWVVDFEVSAWQPTIYDLCTIIFELRRLLLNPLTSQTAVQRCERSFWYGYGAVPENIFVFVNALATARLFYYTLPRLLRWRADRGLWAGMKASLYTRAFEPFVVHRILRISQ